MRVYSWMWIAGVVGCVVSPAQAATFSLKAVQRDGIPLPAPTNLVTAAPGDTITAEVLISGWNADEAGCQLKTYQFAIDGVSAFVHPEGRCDVFLARPCGYDRPPMVFCETNDDCPTESSVCRDGLCEIPCPNPVCPPEWPNCVIDECVGPDHDPEMFSFVDTNHENWCHADFQPAISATSFRSFVNIYQGSTPLDGHGPLDAGQSCYGGTICIQLTEAACGMISVPIFDDPVGLSTFFSCDDGQLHFPTVQGLTIDVQESGVPIACPRIQIVSTDPSNCELTADARAPHRSGAPPTPALGERIFELTFNQDISALFSQSNFAPSFVPTIVAGAPAIQSYAESGSMVTLTLNRPAPTVNAQTGNSPVPRYTCVTVNHPEMGSDNMRCWSHFPGDVDGSLTFDTGDLDLLVEYVEGPSPALYLCDMNYSGACAPSDIIEWIDMANGGGSLGQWLNQSSEPCPRFSCE